MRAQGVFFFGHFVCIVNGYRCKPAFFSQYVQQPEIAIGYLSGISPRYMVLSVPPLTTILSFGLNATHVTNPVCPGNLCVNLLCSTLYIVTHRSAPPTATLVPSRSQLAFLNHPSNPLGAPGSVLYRRGSSFGVLLAGEKGRTSQIFRVSSAPAERRCVPLGESETEVTVSLCPCKE